MKRLVVVILTLCVISGFFGFLWGQETVEPKVQIITISVEDLTPPKVVEVEKIIEKVVEKEVRVEVPVEVPMVLRQFESLTELRKWLGGEGFYFVFGETGSLKCDGIALWLQDKALKEGYLMSFEAIYPDEYNRLFSRMKISYGDNNGLHAINSVIIGKDFYYIEPQTREVVLGGRLNGTR